jgi:hypothetical protein
MSTETKEVSLADFNWDNGDDFFGTTTVEDKPATNITTDDENPDKPSKLNQVTEEEEPDKLVSGEKEEKETDEDFFDEEQEEETELTPKSSQWSSIYKELKSKGVISIDVDDETEIDADRFIEIQEEEIEARLDETIQAFMSELDDDAKTFLKFKREGGDTKQFFEIYSKLSEIPVPSVDDERSQEKFLEYYYSNYEDLDIDDVDDKIQWLKETGKLGKYAEKIYDQLQEDEEKMKAEVLERQKRVAAQQEEQRKQLVRDLKNTIDTANAIKDWTITQKDKKELHGYMTKPAVKTGPNQFLTQFQNDLQGVFKDKEKMILLAKIISSDFDVTDLKEKAKTEVIRETRQKINNQKGNPVQSTKGSRNKGLADYF